jgi:NAD(P)-dependent dehydrogenase (short-subunit alcohol dehydrogenase family)
MGRAIAAALLAEGAHVLAFDRDAAALVETCERLDDGDGRVQAHAGDVSSRGDVRAGLDAALERWGALHVVVAQAGIAGVIALDDIDDDAWTRLVDVNLRGVFLTVQEGARRLPAGGAIVVTASTNAFFPEAHTAHYSATKGGVRTFVKAAALDVAARGIRINVVHPGIIRTRLSHIVTEDPVAGPEYLKGVPLGRFGEPEDVAAAVLFLASDEAAYITGADLVVDGGATVGVTLAVEDTELG